MRNDKTGPNSCRRSCSRNSCRQVCAELDETAVGDPATGSCPQTCMHETLGACGTIHVRTQQVEQTHSLHESACRQVTELGSHNSRTLNLVFRLHGMSMPTEEDSQHPTALVHNQAIIRCSSPIIASGTYLTLHCMSTGSCHRGHAQKGPSSAAVLLRAHPNCMADGQSHPQNRASATLYLMSLQKACFHAHASAKPALESFMLEKVHISPTCSSRLLQDQMTSLMCAACCSSSCGSSSALHPQSPLYLTAPATASALVLDSHHPVPWDSRQPLPWDSCSHKHMPQPA